MKALISFQSNKKVNFEGSRLRKTIKGALELNDVIHTSNNLNEYDIVHLISPEDISKANDASARGIPVVVSALMCEGDKEASYLDYKFDDGKVSYTLKSKALKFLNKVDHVIVPCEKCKELLVESGVTTPIVSIMPGVNLSRFDFTRDDEKQLFFTYFKEDPSKKLVVTLLEGDDIEGITTFKNAALKNPDTLFYMFVGQKYDKRLAKHLKKLIKDTPKNMHISEAVNDDIYRSALINAQIFYLPCYHMSGVISILEAMAAKCEIIMRSQPLLPSFLIDNETAHIARFSETLVSLISDCLEGKLKSTVMNAYDEAKKYDLKTIGGQLKELYQQEIDKNIGGK